MSDFVSRFPDVKPSIARTVSLNGETLSTKETVLGLSYALVQLRESAKAVALRQAVDIMSGKTASLDNDVLERGVDAQLGTLDLILDSVQGTLDAVVNAAGAKTVDDVFDLGDIQVAIETVAADIAPLREASQQGEGQGEFVPQPSVEDNGPSYGQYL